jgi:hypothetical protein
LATDTSSLAVIFEAACHGMVMACKYFNLKLASDSRMLRETCNNKKLHFQYDAARIGNECTYGFKIQSPEMSARYFAISKRAEK